MSNPWFRAYAGLVDDPKFIKLGPDLRSALLMMWCVACANDGRLPPLEDIAIKFRLTEARTAKLLDELRHCGWIDDDETGSAPHNWKARQYQSDNSAERVKRHRAKREAAGLQSQWTAPKALRIAVYTRDNFQCVYCGSEEKLSLDHKTPEIRGGTHDIENLQTACLSCNGAKRDMTHQEYVSRNADVTLLKRPQITEQITEQNKAHPEAKEASAVPASMPDIVEPVDEDPRAKLFRVGKTALASFGVAEKRTGSLIGQWLKTRNDPIGLLAAIQYARDQNVAEPVAYISTLVNGNKSNGQHGKQDLSSMCFAVADELQERERAAGDGRPFDPG
jgi:5-methylcytosine-specific restriction endonuclease McrA